MAMHHSNRRPAAIAAQIQLRKTAGVSWMVHGDLERVAEIASEDEKEPVTPHEIRTFLTQRDAFGAVCLDGGVIVGYILFRSKGRVYKLEQIAVAKAFQLRGHGRQLLAWMQQHLDSPREKIVIAVPESALPTQKFLRACGIKATRVDRNGFTDPPEDAFVFEWVCDKITARR